MYGNEYHIINLFGSATGSVFFQCCLIIFYFNVKQYLLYEQLKMSGAYIMYDRRMKLVIATLLNSLHILLFFLEEDNIVTVNISSIVKALFLFVMM